MLCNLSCNSSRNVLGGGVTSALCEILCRVAMDKILAKQTASAVEESWNLILLSAAVGATRLARTLQVALSVTQRDVSYNLSRRFQDDCGTCCVTDYTVQQDFVINTSVYWVLVMVDCW